MSYSQDRLNILIADDDPMVSSGLSMMLQSLGHSVAACAASGFEAVEKTKKFSPDLVIMDIKMEGMDGLEASRLILDRRPLPIVILTGCEETDVIRQANDIGVCGYIIKPFSQKDLRPALMFAWSRFHEATSLKHEIGTLQDAIRVRKLIEQAKGLLMERECISEAEAYRRIQTMSRNQNVTMLKIAEAIILTSKIRKST